MDNMNYFATKQEKKNLTSKSTNIGPEAYSTYAHKTAELLHYHLCKYFLDKFIAQKEHVTCPNQLKSQQGANFRKKMKNSNVATYIAKLKSHYNLDEGVAKASRKKYNKTKKTEEDSDEESDKDN